MAVLLLLLFSMLNLLPTFYVWHRDGRPANMDYKQPREAEIYGLKIRKLLTPSIHTPVPGLRAWAAADERADFPYDSEGSSNRIGLLASAGFAVLLVLLFRRQRSRPDGTVESEVAPLAARLCLAGVLLATVGGFGAILNLVVADIRGYNRIAVFLAFFCLLGFAHLWRVLYASLMTKPRLQLAARSALVTFLAVCLVDQMADAELLRARASSDHEAQSRLRDFIGKLEAALPAASSLFQLPHTMFPSDGGVQKMLPYDHARAYQASSTLQWSWPTFSRTQEAIVKELLSTPASLLPAALRNYHFSAVWIDRWGYPDQAAAMVRELTVGGARTLLESRDGRYVVMDIQGVSNGGRDAKRFVTPPILLKGFYSWEGAAGNLAWTSGDAEIGLYSEHETPQAGYAHFELGAVAARDVVIMVNGEKKAQVQLTNAVGREMRIKFDAQPGINRLTLLTDTPAGLTAHGDSRERAFYVRRFAWRAVN
jgi:phosphoglycerol transferase